MYSSSRGNLDITKTHRRLAHATRLIIPYIGAREWYKRAYGQTRHPFDDGLIKAGGKLPLVAELRNVEAHGQ